MPEYHLPPSIRESRLNPIKRLFSMFSSEHRPLFLQHYRELSLKRRQDIDNIRNHQGDLPETYDDLNGMELMEILAPRSRSKFFQGWRAALQRLIDYGRLNSESMHVASEYGGAEPLDLLAFEQSVTAPLEGYHNVLAELTNRATKTSKGDIEAARETAKKQCSTLLEAQVSLKMSFLKNPVGNPMADRAHRGNLVWLDESKKIGNAWYEEALRNPTESLPGQLSSMVGGSRFHYAFIDAGIQASRLALSGARIQEGSCKVGHLTVVDVHRHAFTDIDSYVHSRLICTIPRMERPKLLRHLKKHDFFVDGVFDEVTVLYSLEHTLEDMPGTTSKLDLPIKVVRHYETKLEAWVWRGPFPKEGLEWRIIESRYIQFP